MLKAEPVEEGYSPVMLYAVTSLTDSNAADHVARRLGGLFSGLHFAVCLHFVEAIAQSCCAGASMTGARGNHQKFKQPALDISSAKELGGIGSEAQLPKVEKYQYYMTS